MNHNHNDHDYVLRTIIEDVFAGVLTAALIALYVLFLTHVVEPMPDWAVNALGFGVLALMLWLTWKPYDEVHLIVAVMIALLRGCVTWLAIATVYCSIASLFLHQGNQPISELAMTLGNFLFLVSIVVALMRIPADISPKRRRRIRVA